MYEVLRMRVRLRASPGLPMRSIALRILVLPRRLSASVSPVPIAQASYSVFS